MDERTAQNRDSAKADTSLSSRVPPWRTPAVILVCGCLIAMIGFGARSGLGFFLTPMSSAHGWGRAPQQHLDREREREHVAAPTVRA